MSIEYKAKEPAVVTSFSIEGQNPNPYLDEARAYAQLLLQQVIFRRQVEAFGAIIETEGGSVGDPVDLFSSLDAAHILKRRSGVEDLQSRRLVDDVEMTLLGILDSDGMISTASRLSDFLVLLTRIVRMDHRALCLYLIGHNLSTSCSRQFVVDGGFKILKRWVKQAEDEDNVEELRTIVILCKQLPFDKMAAKETQIGKDIKKLLKYKSPTHDVETLHAEIKDLITTWTLAAGRPDSPPVSESTACSSAISTIVATLGQRIFEERGPPKVHVPPLVAMAPVMELSAATDSSATNESKNSISEPAPPAAPRAAADKKAAAGGGEAPPKAAAPVAKAAPKSSMQAQIAANAAKKSAAVVTGAASATAAAATAAATAAAATAANVGSSASASSDVAAPVAPSAAPVATAATAATTTATASRASKAAATSKIDMAEQARKAAAQKQAAEELAAEHQAAALSSRLLTVEPGPSILKRKSDADGAPPPSKRARLDVKFADDAGKELCEVQFFEVDSFKRSTQGEKSKKTHKEMMKRERLLEKNDLLSKNRNSMQRTTDWTLPLALVLSLEIKENSHVEVHSSEKEEQEKRIVHKLEARYMDESLIPADPDDPAGNVGDDEVVEVQVIALKWDTEGDNVQSHASKVSTFSPSELFLFLLLTFPEPHPQPPALQTEPLVHSFYSALPACLHNLEPELLQVLVRDESQIMSLLHDDGSVNAARVALLRQQVSLSKMVPVQPSMPVPPMLPVPPPQLMQQQQHQQHQHMPMGMMPQPPMPPQPMAGHPMFSQPPGVPQMPPIGMGFLPPGVHMGQPPFPHGQPPAVPGFGNQHVFVAPPMMQQQQQQQPPPPPPNTHQQQKQPLQPPRGSKSQPCKFYNSPGGCHFGDLCQFGHNSAGTTTRGGRR